MKKITALFIFAIFCTNCAYLPARYNSTSSGKTGIPDHGTLSQNDMIQLSMKNLELERTRRSLEYASIKEQNFQQTITAAGMIKMVSGIQAYEVKIKNKGRYYTEVKIIKTTKRSLELKDVGMRFVPGNSGQVGVYDLEDIPYQTHMIEPGDNFSIYLPSGIYRVEINNSSQKIRSYNIDINPEIEKTIGGQKCYGYIMIDANYYR